MRPLVRTTLSFALFASCCTTRVEPRDEEPPPPVTAIRTGASGPEKSDAGEAPEAAPLPALAPRPMIATPGPDAEPPSILDLVPYFERDGLDAALGDFHRGRNVKAAEAFEAFAKANPDDVRARPARFLALLARHDAGEADAAAAPLEAMAAEWPEMEEYALFFAGSAHMKAERYEKAEELLARIPASSTLRPRVFELRNKALTKLGRRDEAIRLLSEHLEGVPDAEDDLWLQLADLYEAAGQKKKAKKTLRELALRYPTRTSGHKAKQRLGRKLKLEPAEQLALGRSYALVHNHHLALANLKQAAGKLKKRSQPRCEALLLIARTYDKMKKPSSAWPWFERALGCKGEQLAKATFSGGRNRLKKGDLDTAEQLFERHIAEFPHETTADDAQIYLAEIARRRGKNDEARKLLLGCIERWPDGDMAEQAGWDLLWPLVLDKEDDEALEMSARILGFAGRERSYRAEGRVRYWRGRVLARLGRKDEAKAEWQRVLNEYPLSWYAVLAYARLSADGPEAAREAVETAMAASEPASDPLASIPVKLWRDPNFRRAVELSRLGLHRPAKKEMEEVAAPEGGDEELSWTWNQIAMLEVTGAFPDAMRLARRQEPVFGATWPRGSQRRLWELAHPRPFEPIVQRWAGERDVDANWLWSVMREESSFNPIAESWANAIGLMQIILPTAEHLARGTNIKPTRENLQRPEISIELGSKYLAKLLSEHPVIPLASAGYNAGGGAVRKWRREFGNVEVDEFVERIPYSETRGYAKRVTRSLARYAYLYDDGRLFELDLSPPGPP